MSDDNYNQKDPSKGQKGPGRHSRYVTKAQIRFWQKVLGVFAAILLALGGIVAGSHLILGLTIFIPDIILSAYIIYLEYEHQWRSRRNLRKDVAGFSMGAVVVSVLVPVYLAAELTLSRSPQFSAVSKTSIVSALFDSDHSLGADVLHNAGDNTYMVPVNLFLSIKVTNIGNSNTSIQSLSLATAPTSRGPWRDLCPLDTSGVHIALHFGSRGGNAALLRTDNFAASNLIGQVLQPAQQVSAWTAWECRDQCYMNYRLRIIDSTGRSSYFPLGQTRDDPASLGLFGSDLHLDGRLDVSSIPERHDRDCQ